MKGFFQRLLTIDLSSQTSHTEALDEGLLRQYLGGKGLATHLLLERNPAGVDPLAPESHLIFTPGPVTDSAIYGSCRHGIFAKSPLTGFYGESYSGGSLAVPMSRTGYDAIMIKGAASRPVWLEITDTGVVFHDAGDLWGKDTYDTEAAVRERIDVKKPGVMVIGPAGENLVRFAVVKNDGWRVAGRTGMGAVFGSKKLKALAFYGEQSRTFADPDGIKAYSRAMLKELKNHAATQTYKTQGTPVMVGVLNNAGGFPTRYWSEGTFDQWEKIGAQSLKERCDPKPKSCKTCFMACGKRVSVQEGRHRGLTLEGPEYETIYSFGGLCMIDQIEEIIYLNDLCDRMGIDTISGGNLAAFAIEASRRGKISGNFDYGDPELVAEILRKIVRREGIGDLLAEGIRPASEELGLTDIAVHVKGMEPAGYDPRSLKGMGLAYAVSDRGACHLRSTFYKAELSGMIDPNQIEGKAEMFIDFESRCTLFDCLILCRFYRDFYPWEELGKIIAMTTGIELDQEGLSQLAARVTDNTRRFNIREGLTVADDRLPKRFLKERIKGDRIVTEDEIQTLVQDYYHLRGWDAQGIPPAAV
ncbi:aldehyde:ferredoxin oxidoreductase [Desulfonema ishimotonii]|uniref:Aldehyde:ferredoxin oxidoreductase n=1 Tax=Desulfonema ishimotonii TaxID=45657 RepID=A0A401G141_9BACT|nr:aldehyde ferredoxin oxidoreductase family protein [Desulfonema ishimotonii]GBC62903.1 aldehyde:ferredoxin oxidoreductase [Desulfonema ishimotonii]